MPSKGFSLVSIAILMLVASLAAQAQLESQVSQEQSGTSGMWTVTGRLGTARSGQAVALLADGRVLAAGGMGGATALASSELYDPETGLWSPTGNLNLARSAAPAVMLSGGKVLVAGGCIDTCIAPTSSVEVYDPSTGTWSETGSLNTPRYFHSVTLLKNGKVLVAGGCNAPNCATATGSAELYNPNTGTWAFTGSLHSPRDLHTATGLANGKVMVAGGFGATGILSAVEIYNPATGKWTSAGNMQEARMMHAATLLANGQVLVTGGFGGPFHTLLCGVEILDPATAKWTFTHPMWKMRDHHTATLLQNGKVLVAGGTGVAVIDGKPVFVSVATTELYDPGAGTWSMATMSNARSNHSATLLNNGDVLAAGGIGSQGEVADAEFYKP
jgi:hypothetical protein